MASTELGSGGYGRVVIAKNNETGERVAAKIVSTSRMKMSAIEKEINLMAKLNHPNIVGLKGKEKIDKKIVIFMELAEGGELFSRVISAGVLTEDQARPYFRELCLAVKYMHSQGVVHRDLKLENVLLHEDQCKVCDFGLAHVYDPDPEKPDQFKLTPLREVCGSKSYCAPEVLEGKGYDGFPYDMWSCGICLFAMLAGFFPLDEASGADWRYERVKMAASQQLSATHTIFGFYERPCVLSQEVTDLIDGMLVVTPSQRLTVQQVLESPWMTGAKIATGADRFGAVYRSGAMNGISGAELEKLYAEESDEQMPQAPVYRGLPVHLNAAVPGAAPPSLKKQAASRLLGADFMLLDEGAA